MATLWNVGSPTPGGNPISPGNAPISATYNQGRFANPGALMLARYLIHDTGGSLTGVAFTDNMTSVGWNLAPPSIFASGANSWDVLAWKIVSEADYQAQTGAPRVTATPTGVSSSSSAFLGGCIATVPWPGFEVGGIDLHAVSAPGVVNSYSIPSAVGSARPSDADQLAYVSYNNGVANFGVNIALVGSLTPTPQFDAVGFSPVALNSTTILLTGGLSGPIFESSVSAGGIHADASAGSNSFIGSITGTSPPPDASGVIRCATFWWKQDGRWVGVA